MKLIKSKAKYLWLLAPIAVGFVATIGVLAWRSVVLAPVVTNRGEVSEQKPKTTLKKQPSMPSFNKKQYSNTDPSSIWVVVNKQHPLTPLDYAPTNLITTVGATISINAQADFEAMNSAALSQGVNFTIVSSYRSYASQSSIYNGYVATYGQASTDTFSARPGYSEHQTGLAVDLGSSSGAICNLDDCFGTTTEGQWLAAHSYEYGFIVRYPSDKQSVTGYKSEPWHLRYIGRELAAEMKKQSITTLEEFFGITGGELYL